MSVEPWSREWVVERLRTLRREWANCRACNLCQNRKRVVFGEGNPKADLMFIGEAPGETEDEKGEPFCGESGMILRSMLEGLEVDWGSIYVTNLVCCRPPGNRDPVKPETNACFDRLQEQIYLVDPLIIVAVGKVAMQFLIGGRAMSIEDKHGELLSPGAPVGGLVFPRTDDKRVVHNLTYPVVPIFHPAYILRKDSYDKETDTFTAGGIADQTFRDLEDVLVRLERIRSVHEQLEPTIARRRDTHGHEEEDSE